MRRTEGLQRAVLENPLSEGAAVDEFHDDPRRLILDHHVVEGDDVRV
ncbi:hypothetical protein SMD20_26140 [Nonomuraea sp. LP-02]|nr:hypothetical protein [Nonomuraea sp. LP-02]MED7927767.1 hypothetical protein [Nonomuraea sp. LP-02]